MINPYAQSLFVATRTTYIAPPRLRPAKDDKPQRRRFALFRRATGATADKL